MFCHYCGKKMDEKAAFCPYCGRNTIITNVDSFEKQSTGTASTKKSKRIVIVISIAIAVLSLVIVSILVNNQLQSDKSLNLTLEDANGILTDSLDSIFESADESNFLSQSLRNQISVQVESISEEEGQVLAKCQVTAPDYKKAITDFLDELEDGSPNDYSELMEKLNMNLKAADQMEKQFVIEFVAINESYEPIIPEDMVVFCNGNVQELIPLFVELLEGGI